MNFQFYVEKLKNSPQFKEFIQKNKDAFPASGFFIMEFSNSKHPDNKQHFDYYIPSKNKMFSFKLEDNCAMVPVEIVDNTAFKPISLEHDFNFNEIVNIVSREMESKNIKSKVQKILLSLQNKNSKDYLVGTVFISNFGLLKINIDLKDMSVIHFEKKSFFDMLKITGKGGRE
jgi:hypothetical protein